MDKNIFNYTSLYDYAIQTRLYSPTQQKEDLVYIENNELDYANIVSRLKFKQPKKSSTICEHCLTNEELTGMKQWGELTRLDHINWGYSDIGYASAAVMDNEWPVELNNLANSLGFEEPPLQKVLKQSPGQMFPLHIDVYQDLRTEEQQQGPDMTFDPEIRRVFIALNDWEPGHYYQIGNSVWHNWKAGDAVTFRWGVPHSTANSGNTDRYTLILTGRVKPGSKIWA